MAEYGGQRVSDRLDGAPTFDNADYFFPRENVLAELKTLKTDVGRTRRFEERHLKLTKTYLQDGRMSFGAIFRAKERPREFVGDFLRLFRPPLERILKKANSQIKQTRENLKLKNAHGILLLINDEFVSLEPQFIMGIISQKLVHSYSSIDAFIYITLNHYVEIPISEYAHLLWAPVYSDRGMDILHPFINDLGASWFKFLDREIGPFDISLKTEDGSFLKETRAIPRPVRKD